MTAAEDQKKQKIEAAVKDCDVILAKMRRCRATIADPDVTDFDAIASAKNELTALNQEYAERRGSVFRDLHHIGDRDFQGLIQFHFSRADRSE
jgi:hypothetical protein